jgi:hypothetical protein
MRATLPFLLFYLLFFANNLWAQAPFETIEKKQYTTAAIHEGDIVFDGILDDAVWNTVEWGGDFIQHMPDAGKAPAQNTSFKILFSEKYLYVAYRCHDTAPDSIVQRMSRRDQFPGDWVEINIDSYHDLRTAFSFTFSVSGVRGDEFVSNNGNNWDTNWNPIWDGRSHIDSLGWTAEIKIPFSQLRYGNQKNPVWGFQVMRRVFRKEERSTWQFIPQTANGWVSEFGELHGLHNLPDNKQVELAPYMLAKAERFEKQEGNPFADGSRNQFTAGLDGKLAVTRDLILDYTINPDFGQVEADPGAVRLDGYEVFFGERRPFFVESRNLFDYRVSSTSAGGDFDSDLLFYSRRIGGRPHGYPSLQAGEFADIPQNSSILGAAKFSGKTKDGWSIGVLESVTQRENATIDLNGERRSELVEPLTNYFVGRVLKDYDEGNTILGAVFTGVQREKGLDFIHQSAYSGGLDFQHFWKNRWYFVTGKVIMSRVNGTQEAILNTQQGFVHFFQRPNAPHLSIDSTRTNLTGTGGTFKIGKWGGNQDKRGGIFKFETGITWRSPELELNDIGFLLAADEINHFNWIGYHIQKPFSVFRNMRFNYNHYAKWDFGGQFLYSAFNTNAHAWFKNNWRTGTGFTYNPQDISNNALRGGSSLRRPSGIGYFAYLGTDERKKVAASAEFNLGSGFNNTVSYRGYFFSIDFQPLDNLQISIQPGYSNSWRKQDQYVAQTEYNGQVRTIVSEVNQNDLSLTSRINYNITPNLTIQYYGQPYIFRAKYQNYGFVKDPLNHDFNQRFHQYTASETTYKDGTYSIDEDLDGNTDYTFNEPDFNFIQFRSNLVVRWEYIPGSELFLVWSQGATPNASSDLNTPLGNSLFNNIFNEKPRNIFLVKFTYRFLL